VIRDFEPGDAKGVSAVLHEERIPHPVTPEGVLHWNRAQPERAQARSWVAVDGDRIAGWGRARLRWSTSAEGISDVWVYVAPPSRGRGLGSALFELAERHAHEIDARSVNSWAYHDSGRAFLEARGFRASGGERISRLEPANADISALGRLEDQHAAQGFELAPLAEVRHCVEDLHRVYAAASADVPQEFREDDVRLEEWRRETLAHPQLSDEGSFVVLGREGVVALAFVELDESATMAANEMTGTLPEFRRRGLARLVKLATIRWASEHRISAMLTSNAEENVAVVALNESLGYRLVERETHYLRDE
jgi:GNAT superfamily N-acetyltransferase